MIEIQHGCAQRSDGLWVYAEIKSPTGDPSDVKLTNYVFYTPEGVIPEVGSFIDNGQYVKRTEPKVNSDWSRWQDKDLYGPP